VTERNILEDEFPTPAAGDADRAYDQQQEFEHNPDRGLSAPLDQWVQRTGFWRTTGALYQIQAVVLAVGCHV
jgi:hypothetical protein